MTNTLKKALALAELGLFVFPVRLGDDGTKTPLTEKGHHDATRDPGVIEDMWRVRKDAEVGVDVGRSGLNVLDVDVKNGKDGFETIADEWLDIPDTVDYPTPSGLGRHYVYRAPEGVALSPAGPYRKMEGVDRRAGSSWVLWNGDVPESYEAFSEAPEWLNDPAVVRTAASFEGDLQDWYERLTPGAPNRLVRAAIDRISADMGHADMVEAQMNAIRLGAEGNPGVDVLLEALEQAWLERDPGNHTTPENDWEYKFQEALQSGVEKYGAAIELFENMPDYSISLVPTTVPNRLVLGQSGNPSDFSALLGSLVEATDDDMKILSILWNCPKTSEAAREIGLESTYRRIELARQRPEPTRENPALADEERISTPAHGTQLLTDEEREYISTRPTFIDHYLEAGQRNGFANPVYFRAAAWSVMSMAFGFRAFLPVTATDKMGVNTWNITLGYSGTGKTRAVQFRDSCLRALFNGDSELQGYFVGADSSPQGLHLALLKRDHKASFFGADEAAGFFKQLVKRDHYATGLDDTLARWYDGWVDPSSKMTLKEYTGKSAMTSLTIQMFGTPDRVTEVLTRDMFMTGFLARFNWSIGDLPIETDARFNLLQEDETESYDETPDIISDLVLDLVSAVSRYDGVSQPVRATREALDRMSAAYKRMHTVAKERENWDITEPSVTRLMETMRKCAAMLAIYRGERVIRMEDALNAIQAVEEWFNNLFTVAAMISAGTFQRQCDEIEDWIRKRRGKATRESVLHNFRNWIQRDQRDLDTKLDFLVSSGRLNREEADGGSMVYRVNGG